MNWLRQKEEDTIDQEKVLAELCRLLLTRYVIAQHHWSDSDDRVMHVPNWIVNGIAQHLYKEVRSRNMKLAQQSWAKAEGLTVQDVMVEESFEHITQRALAAAATAWIAETTIDRNNTVQ